LGELTPEPGRFVPLLVAACDRALQLHKEDLPDAAVTALGEYGPLARDALPRLRQFLEGPIKGRTVRSDLVETAIRSITADAAAVKPAAVADQRTEPLSADEPVFAVVYEQKQCYIDRQGRIVLRTRFVDGEPFRDGRAIVHDEARRTFVIDREGREVFESRWDEIRSFSEGRAAVKKENRWGFVDPDGRTVVEPQYDGVWDFAEGLAGFSIGGKEVPLGKSGTWSAPGLKGFIDRTGTVVIPPVWPLVTSFREGLAAVCVGGRKQSSPLLAGHEILLDLKYGYIDRTGKLVIPGGYDLANRFFEGRAVVCNETAKCRMRKGYIDTDGNQITPLKLTSASAFRDGLAVVKRRGRKWRKVTFVIDRAGEVVAELRFSEVKPFSEGLAAASSGDGFGFIDLDGKWVIEPQFDQVDPFQNSLAEVQRGNWYGLIDKTGQFIWGPTTEGALFWKCESD
jgi:WG repeat protein